MKSGRVQFLAFRRGKAKIKPNILLLVFVPLENWYLSPHSLSATASASDSRSGCGSAPVQRFSNAERQGSKQHDELAVWLHSQTVASLETAIGVAVRRVAQLCGVAATVIFWQTVRSGVRGKKPKNKAHVKSQRPRLRHRFQSPSSFMLHRSSDAYPSECLNA
ncbi:uncharacterized protein LOC121404714 [Drosophila obscura]|uniref:uncharacterized protein LOC121404714 n=1 Tax=Drosophila obscura TaxID=7282 RepID=UPI001BB1F380|nr:uncharacterized protein LOC121404714 [Drosophila obscura]